MKIVWNGYNFPGYFPHNMAWFKFWWTRWLLNFSQEPPPPRGSIPPSEPGSLGFLGIDSKLIRFSGWYMDYGWFFYTYNLQITFRIILLVSASFKFIFKFSDFLSVQIILMLYHVPYSCKQIPLWRSEKFKSMVTFMDVLKFLLNNEATWHWCEPTCHYLLECLIHSYSQWDQKSHFWLVTLTFDPWPWPSVSTISWPLEQYFWRYECPVIFF